MKNRYGMDGLTYGAKIDTSMGLFETISDDELESITPADTKQSYGQVSDSEKEQLRQHHNFFLNN
jgi:hypothetical protein